MRLNNKRTTQIAWVIVVPSVILGLILIIFGAVNIFSDEDTASNEIQVGDERAIDAGRFAYLQYCAICHAPDASGIPGLGKDLIESEFVVSTENAELQAFIITGRSIDDPANTTGIAMPARGGNSMLSDGEISQIIAYLRYRAE